MFRVGAANPLLMFPNPESGRRVNNVLLISHAPKIQRQPSTEGLVTIVEKPQRNLQYLMDPREPPSQQWFSQREPCTRTSQPVLQHVIRTHSFLDTRQLNTAASDPY